MKVYVKMSNSNEIFSALKKCSQCGEEKARTSECFNRNKNSRDGLKSACKECIKLYQIKTKDAQRLRQARYVEKNREEIKKRQKEHTIKNKERKKEYDKEYYEENKESIAKQGKEYYYNNYEEIQRYSKDRNADPEVKKQRREYRKTRKERDAFLHKEWRLKNIQRISTNKQRRYSRQKSLESTLIHEEWLSAIEAFDGECAYCGNEVELTRDHFIPVTKDGGFTVENIVPACRSCNSSKNNRSFFEWYLNYEFYSEDRQKKILEYLGFSN